jgi:hypothetical protein
MVEPTTLPVIRVERPNEQEALIRRAVAVERERCAKIAEQTETWNQSVEETDCNDIYTGNYKTVERITPKWRDGKAIAAAIRGA